jgi:hypothetical protein
MTPTRWVVLVGLLALVGAAAYVLTRADERRAGTNLTSDTGFVVPVPAQQQLCEPGELLPAGTAALRVTASAGAAPGPPLEATVTGSSPPASSGRLAGGWRPGAIRIPVSPRLHETSGGTVCIRNLGTRPVAFGGSVPDDSFLVTIGGRALSGRVRIEYMRPGRETWLALIPVLSHRFSLAKGDLVRHWAALATLLLILFAVGLATRTMLAAEPDP